MPSAAMQRAGQLLGRVNQQCRDVPPPDRPGYRDLMNQRVAAGPESGIVGLHTIAR
jgi:hypothetical protein